MKIHAASRLTALIIEDQKYAYPESDGLNRLKEWFKVKPKATMVKTSDPSVTIGVIQKGKSFYVYLLKDHSAIGVMFLGREARGIYSPTSFLSPQFRGQGYALMLYSWVLDNGMCLINTVSQSPYSHGLWKRLARDYTLVAIDDVTKKMKTGPDALKVMSLPKYDLALLAKGADKSKLKAYYG